LAAPQAIDAETAHGPSLAQELFAAIALAGITGYRRRSSEKPL
jgi:MYXO-CTERM domain-containing protein